MPLEGMSRGAVAPHFFLKLKALPLIFPAYFHCRPKRCTVRDQRHDERQTGVEAGCCGKAGQHAESETQYHLCQIAHGSTLRMSGQGTTCPLPGLWLSRGDVLPGVRQESAWNRTHP